MYFRDSFNCFTTWTSAKMLYERRCPVCRQTLKRKNTWRGLLWAILCFPCGMFCCMRRQRTRCSACKTEVIISDGTIPTAARAFKSFKKWRWQFPQVARRKFGRCTKRRGDARREQNANIAQQQDATTRQNQDTDVEQNAAMLNSEVKREQNNDVKKNVKDVKQEQNNDVQQNAAMLNKDVKREQNNDVKQQTTTNPKFDVKQELDVPAKQKDDKDKLGDAVKQVKWDNAVSENQKLVKAGQAAN